MLLDDLFAECAEALELKHQFHLMVGNEQKQARKAQLAKEVMSSMRCQTITLDFDYYGDSKVKFDGVIYGQYGNLLELQSITERSPQYSTVEQVNVSMRPPSW